ncbi:hypothetical protein NQ317_006337 [Molorchus minor]|uniref:RNA-directed DNA polymerase n=1 Tax=Molorchus minor TaxID=1323400 RepID=A0ABQ9IUB4_9CUCU|nr:hypothetical protein NQ317_006337 [Molorchus minor]
MLRTGFLFEIVDNLHETCILGATFLHDAQAVLDYSRRCLHLGMRDRFTVFWHQAVPEVVNYEVPAELNVPPEHRQELLALIEEFAPLFHYHNADVNSTASIKHTIRLREDKVVRLRPYPMSHDKKQLLNELVEQMLAAGVIERSHSEYSSPPLLVEAPGKKPRFCVDFLNELYEQVADRQKTSPRTRRNKLQWIAIERDAPNSPAERKFHISYLVENDLLYKVTPTGPRLVAPRSMNQLIIHTYHDTPETLHPGQLETARKIQEYYYWSTMLRDVQAYVNNCILCATAKHHRRHPKAKLTSHYPTSPFQMWAIDVLGPYTTSTFNNNYILIAEDIFSHWIEAKPIPEADGKAVLKFVQENIVARYGIPEKLITDQGTVFSYNKLIRFCQQQKIEILSIAVELQRANPVERKVQDLKIILGIKMQGKRESTWETYLPQAIGILHSRRNAATGETPAKLVLGYELPLPGEWQLARYRQQRRQRTRPERAVVRERMLNFKQRYADKNAQKPFDLSWTGPYLIVEQKSPLVYTVEREGRNFDFHIDFLRCPPGNDPQEVDTTPVSSDEDTDLYHEATSPDESDSDGNPPPAQLRNQLSAQAKLPSHAVSEPIGSKPSLFSDKSPVPLCTQPQELSATEQSVRAAATLSVEETELQPTISLPQTPPALHTTTPYTEYLPSTSLNFPTMAKSRPKPLCTPHTVPIRKKTGVSKSPFNHPVREHTSTDSELSSESDVNK